MARIGRGRRRLGALSFALVFLGMNAAPALSAPPEDAWHLDDGFGTGGEAVTSFGPGFDEAFDVALQNDGKVVVVGRAHPTDPDTSVGALARYTPNGILDTAFGDGGTLLTTNTSVNSEATGLAVQPDGKIVVAGAVADANTPDGRPEIMVMRYTRDGQVDPSFGVAGRFTQQIGNLSYGRGVAIYPPGSPNAGKIVVSATYSDLSKQTHEWIVLRLLPDGTLDGTFGSGGGALPDPGLGDDEVGDVAIDQNDRVIVIGSGLSSGGSREEVAVLKANGTLDTSFGDRGFALDSYEDNSQAFGVDIDPTTPGRFAVAGQVGGSSAGSDMAVWRYDATGKIVDRAFPDFFQKNDSAEDVVIQPDGRVVLIGWAAEEGTGDTTCSIVDFALAGFRSDLKPDPTFGNDDQFGANSNKLVTGFGFGYDAAFGGAIQPDGDIVVVGGTNQAPLGQCQSTPLGNIDFGVARYTGPGAPGPDNLRPRIGLLLDFTLAVKPDKLKVTWTGGNPLATNTYDLRMQGARWYTNEYGSWRTLLTKTRKTSTTVGLTPGNTYCFEARTHSGGKTSPWSKTECVATPVDDKTLSGDHWYRYVPPHAPGYYNGTGSGTLVKGAELHLDDAWFRQVEIVYTECRNCGRFVVLVDDRKVDLVNSANSKDVAKRVEYVLSRKTPSRHDVTIKVIDPGSRGVYIDGVGVSLAPKG